jgi:hypothetical protein
MIHYQVNNQHVAHEIIENEVVIIHLDNGNYFNLEGVGTDIWNGIVANMSKTDIINSLLNSYEGEEELITESVNNFINQLESEELIIPSDEIEKINQVTREYNETNQKNIFTPPVLQKYEDMQDLLLLDPLHDVNETTGWPMRK